MTWIKLRGLLINNDFITGHMTGYMTGHRTQPTHMRLTTYRQCHRLTSNLYLHSKTVPWSSKVSLCLTMSLGVKCSNAKWYFYWSTTSISTDIPSYLYRYPSLYIYHIFLLTANGLSVLLWWINVSSNWYIHTTDQLHVW